MSKAHMHAYVCVLVSVCVGGMYGFLCVFAYISGCTHMEARVQPGASQIDLHFIFLRQDLADPQIQQFG